MAVSKGVILSTYLDVLSTEHQQIVGRATRNVAGEFVGTVGPETVERCVADSLAHLASTATVSSFLPVLAERFARERLRALVKVRVEGAKPSAVVFLCAHNAGRSQIAAAWLRHFCPESVSVWSAGTEPAGHIGDDVVGVLAEVGIDISGEFPKPWTDEVIDAADVIVTMGCGEACPVVPGKRYEYWVLVHALGPGLENARSARDEIRARVEQLAGSLGLVVS